MSATNIDISIIIPTKNGVFTLDRVLSTVFAQNTTLQYEVIVIDSGSTDNTLSVLSKYPVRLYQISPEEFSHSKTRNYGASLSQAESYLLFLNQDAVPLNEFWLDNLVKSIEFESGIKAVCATELADETGYFNVYGVASFVFNNSHTKGLYIIEPYLLSRTNNLSKYDQRKLFPFSTVCAIFDKAHFMVNPFDEKVEWGEDLHWAVDNSNKGYRSACTSLAQVFHHHDYSEQEYKVIMNHTKKLYKELFAWEEQSLDDFIVTVNSKMGAFEATRRIEDIVNSLSWRITAPLRLLHKRLMHRKSK